MNFLIFLLFLISLLVNALHSTKAVDWTTDWLARLVFIGCFLLALGLTVKLTARTEEDSGFVMFMKCGGIAAVMIMAIIIFILSFCFPPVIAWVMTVASFIAFVISLIYLF